MSQPFAGLIKPGRHQMDALASCLAATVSRFLQVSRHILLNLSELRQKRLLVVMACRSQRGFGLVRYSFNRGKLARAFGVF